VADDLDTITLPDAAQARAQARFDRPAIFGRTCPRTIALLARRRRSAPRRGDRAGAILNTKCCGSTPRRLGADVDRTVEGASTKGARGADADRAGSDGARGARHAGIALEISTINRSRSSAQQALYPRFEAVAAAK
jgi:hypothetical protein